MEQVENKNVTEGDNVEVYCNVTAGIPDPTVMWTNVSSGEHIEGNPLNITNMSQVQAGEYRCTANNTCGEASTLININVQCKNAIRSFYMIFMLERFNKKGRRTMQFTKCVRQVLVSKGCGW